MMSWIALVVCHDVANKYCPCKGFSIAMPASWTTTSKWTIATLVGRLATINSAAMDHQDMGMATELPLQGHHLMGSVVSESLKCPNNDLGHNLENPSS